MTRAPTHHDGIPYAPFLAALSQKRRFRRYLEIGVNEGSLMSVIHADRAIGVDPEFRLNSNVVANKRVSILCSTTSDEFFASPDLMIPLGGCPDFSFLDGYHTFEFLLRDFMNTERVGSRTSLIGLHDCLPLDDIMTERSIAQWRHKTAGSRYEGSWTGDVWKILPILAKYRPDLRILPIDCPPTGVVCITGLDPTSTVLQSNYLRIIEEFRSLGNTMENIEALYEGITMISSREILNEFDHSLFFVT